MLTNWPYLLLLALGVLLINNGSTLELGLSSRIMNSNGGFHLGVGVQRVLGVMAVAYSLLKIVRNRT